MRSIYRSIAFKNALVYLGILLIACVTLGTFLFVHNARTVRNHLIEQVDHTHELIKVDFDDYIDDISKNVSFLSEGVLVKQVLADPGATRAKEILSQQFLDILAQNQDYNQVRLIGGESGMELIRADRSKGTPNLLPDSALQNKSDRSYYKEARDQHISAVIFSPIDLNKEYGVISDPVTPTLRAFHPIHIDGKFAGLVVINLDLRGFFDRIASFAGPGQVFHVFTNSGDYLIHPDPSMTFGFEYGRPALAADQMEAFNEDGSAASADEVVNQFFQRWDYPRDSYYLVCALSIDEAVMNQPLRSLGLSHFLYLSLILTLAILMIAWIARRQSRYLSQVTRAMAGFNVEDVDLDDVSRRNDEFGELARAFAGLQKTIQEQIKQLTMEKAIAQKATRDKETFIENMSHELRNPLQNIKGMLSVLKNNKLREDQQPIINAMTFSAGQLEVLINDVLDFGLLKEGKIELQLSPVKIRYLITEIIQSHRFEAGLKQVELNLEGPDDESLIMLDPTRFTQILSNLLSNAIKFSHKGGEVWVIWLLKPTDSMQQILEVQVKDNGRGMTKDELSRVQGRFERVDQESSGSGLGLPVVHELLKLFGSRLVMESRANEGTSCSFTLEVGHALDGDNKTRVQDVELATWGLYQRPMSILIIEDDPQLEHLYRHYFQEEGMVVRHFTSWSEWTELEDSARFDMICSDVNLGTVNVTQNRDQVLEVLRADGLLLWCSGQPLDHFSFSSCESFLVKPVSKTDLIEAWNLHWEKLWSKPPVINNIRADYDHEEKKVSKAINLLSREWKTMLAELSDAFSKGKEQEASQVYHRLTTTLKRLELFLQDEHIGLWLEDFQDMKVNEIRADILKTFEQQVSRYLAKLG
jgi:signal transduction histidine kinase